MAKMTPSRSPASRVDEIMMARGMSQTEAAKAAGLQVPTFAKIRTGVTQGIAPDKAAAISKAFGVQVPDLFAAIGSAVPAPSDEFIAALGDSKSIKKKAQQAVLLALWDELEIADERELAIRLIRGLLLSRDLSEAS